MAFYIGQPQKDPLKSQIQATAGQLRAEKYPVSLKDLGALLRSAEPFGKAVSWPAGSTRSTGFEPRRRRIAAAACRRRGGRRGPFFGTSAAVTMSTRTKLGVLALFLIAAAGVLKVFGSSSPFAAEGWMECYCGSPIILGTIWLAYPDVSRLPLWTFPALALIGLAAFRWKVLLLAVPPVLFFGWLPGKCSAAGPRLAPPLESVPLLGRRRDRL